MAVLLFSIIIWSVFHSLMAGTTAKNWFEATFGGRTYVGLYRLLFNIVAGWTLLPILYLLVTRAPNGLVWSVPMPYRIVNYIVQLVGLLGALFSLIQTDMWHFTGIKQFVSYFRGDSSPKSPQRFVDTGTYGLVRHPLYFFSLLFLWANPTMSWMAFIASLWATVYFVVGSFLEERRLIAQFGEPYRHYQSVTPRFVPFLRVNRKPSNGG